MCVLDLSQHRRDLPVCGRDLQWLTSSCEVDAVPGGVAPGPAGGAVDARRQATLIGRSAPTGCPMTPERQLVPPSSEHLLVNTPPYQSRYSSRQRFPSIPVLFPPARREPGTTGVGRRGRSRSRPSVSYSSGVVRSLMAGTRCGREGRQHVAPIPAGAHAHLRGQAVVLPVPPTRHAVLPTGTW